MNAHPAAYAVALHLAHGDRRLLRVNDDGSVTVCNRPVTGPSKPVLVVVPPTPLTYDIRDIETIWDDTLTAEPGDPMPAWALRREPA